MNWKKWFLVTAGLACGMVAAGAGGLHLWTAYAGDMRTVPLRSTGLGQVDVKAPAGEPNAFIVLLSDVQGATPSLNRFADELVSQGAAVITLSTPDLLRSLDATKTGTCHYALGLFEDLSQTAQRTLNVDTYRWPVVLGIGQGGTVAFLSEAQSPVNTAAGAVSVGFDPALRTRLPFCGDPSTKAADGTFVYSPPPSLTGRWIVIPPGTLLAHVMLTYFVRVLRPLMLIYAHLRLTRTLVMTSAGFSRGETCYYITFLCVLSMG